jgi:hypothetical protein
MDERLDISHSLTSRRPDDPPVKARTARKSSGGYLDRRRGTEGSERCAPLGLQPGMRGQMGCFFVSEVIEKLPHGANQLIVVTQPW